MTLKIEDSWQTVEISVMYDENDFLMLSVSRYLNPVRKYQLEAFTAPPICICQYVAKNDFYKQPVFFICLFNNNS